MRILFVSIYCFIYISFSIFYYYFSKRDVYSLVGSSENSRRNYKKNNISPYFIFTAAFFIYTLIGLIDRVNDDSVTNDEFFVFASISLVGILMFTLGYGKDNFIISKQDNYSSTTRIKFSEKKISYIELLILLVFIICCVVFHERLYNMIVNFGKGKAYQDYSIRDDRTAISGIESAISHYFTLIMLLLPFYRIYKYKKINIIDVFILVIIFSYALFSGNRTNIILIVLMLAVLINQRFFHLNMIYLIIGTLVFALLLSLIGHLRKYNDFYSMLNMLKTEDELSELLLLSNSGEFRNTTGTTFTYISQNINNNKYDLGYVYIIDLAMYIPSFLFFSRPLPPQEQYMLDFFPLAEKGTGHGWFILTDGYRAFGVFGVIIEMYIMGKFIKFVYKKFFYESKNPLNNFLYVYFLLFVFYSVRSSFLLSIKNYVIEVFPVLLLLVIDKYLLRADEGIYITNNISQNNNIG